MERLQLRNKISSFFSKIETNEGDSIMQFSLVMKPIKNENLETKNEK